MMKLIIILINRFNYLQFLYLNFVYLFRVFIKDHHYFFDLDQKFYQFHMKLIIINHPLKHHDQLH